MMFQVIQIMEWHPAIIHEIKDRVWNGAPQLSVKCPIVGRVCVVLEVSLRTIEIQHRDPNPDKISPEVRNRGINRVFFYNYFFCQMPADFIKNWTDC